MRIVFACADKCEATCAGTRCLVTGASRCAGACAPECAGACAPASACATMRAPLFPVGCYGNAPLPELIISCGKCAGGGAGAGRAEEAAARSCLPPAGRAPGAAATPGSCLHQAGESGPWGGQGAGWAMGLRPACGSGRRVLAGPARGTPPSGPAGSAERAWAPRPSRARVSSRRHPARDQNLAASWAWGLLVPSGLVPISSCLGECRPYLGAACQSAPGSSPLPRRGLHLEGCGFGLTHNVPPQLLCPCQAQSGVH